ncbi:UNVERIFIED_CONTAM: hypothetical protein HDU68_010533 [Siphonaria sp. JEL0065]|nr:hypothetical protein HDU68_010533 [Siphonaria sp. JEL0065]
MARAILWSCTNATYADCNDQPCWASIQLCSLRDPLLPCSPVNPSPTGACSDGRFRYAAHPDLAPLANATPANRSLDEVPADLKFAPSPPIRSVLPPISQTAAATSALTSSTTTTTTTAIVVPIPTPDSSFALIGGAIGAVCFLSGLFAAYFFIAKRRRLAEQDDSVAAIGGSSSSKFIDTIAVSSADPSTQPRYPPAAPEVAATNLLDGGGRRLHPQLMRKEVNLNDPLGQDHRIERGFHDDFFDDETSSIGRSTHISVDVGEIRPFQGVTSCPEDIPVPGGVTRMRPQRGIDDLRGVVDRHHQVSQSNF